MHGLKENARLLRQNRKKGISLVIAMCASALILGLSLYVIRVAGTLLRQSADRVEQERCSQLARSFAQVLETELHRGEMEEGNFYALACEALETGERVRCTAKGKKDDEILTVVIRPAEQKKEPVSGSGSFPWEESPEMVEQICRENSFLAGGFTLSVAAELGRESYVCSTAYHSYHRVQTLFFWNGETRVYWDGQDWYTDAECTRPMTVEARPDGADVSIHWYYDDSVVEEINMIPLREEGGTV